MDDNSRTIFVTGGTGFIGSHVVEELLRQGYQIRCSVRRSARTDFFTKYHSKRIDDGQFQVVEVPDLLSGEYYDAFKGVDAVIHLASPPGRATAEEIYTGAVDGALNVLAQAEKAGVKRFVITGMIQTGKLERYLETREEVVRCKDIFTVYESCKVLSQKAVWKWAETHPHVDITYINLPMAYGPFCPSFHLPTPLYPGVNRLLYQLLVPTGNYPFTGQYVDVRDAAKVHISALDSPPTSSSSPQKKEFIFASPELIDFERIVALLSKERPDLRNRLITREPPLLKEQPLPCDYERITAILKYPKQEFTRVEQTVLDTIDNYVEIEAAWIEQGYSVEIPHY